MTKAKVLLDSNMDDMAVFPPQLESEYWALLALDNALIEYPVKLYEEILSFK
jgi:hypothetical protein